MSNRLKHNAHNAHDDIEPVLEQTNKTAEKVLDAAFKIHRLYGPGLLENAYEKLMVYELVKNHDLKVEAQKTLPLNHEGHLIDAGYRLDLLVDDCVIVELKATESILPLHQAQLMTYLKLSGIRLGLLLNFNCKLMKEGIRRIVM